MKRDPAPDYLRLVPAWSCGPDQEVLRTRIFTLLKRRCASPTNPSRAGEFYVLRCPDWVNVIALTDRREVVMVEQFRFGLNAVTLEFPAGLVEPGEDPAVTCSRELLEETGYGGGPVRIIGRMAANPALNSNYLHVGLVTGARPLGPTKLDEHEEIDVRLVPLAEIPDLIRREVIVHSFVTAAYQYLLLAGL
jgi:8-oxo-dGTP pyrophosphatase MutT (NUDIX family)